ncbi:MAG: molybdopterin-binding protein [Bradyrhizobium sp.]|jgi:molybdopterin molybdotransferase
MTQRLPASLTSLDASLEALLHRLEPVAPVAVPLGEALGCVGADMPALKPHPSRDIAVTDGWALRSRDLVGASSYSPLPLATIPVWVEAGEALPEGCDCVLEADAVDPAGPLVQALAEAIPGQGIRRAGGEITGASAAVICGRQIQPADMLLARAAGLRGLNVRRPRLRLVNIPSNSGEALTAQLIMECASAAGADVLAAEAPGRDAASIASTLDVSACDLLITVGGSGEGRTDATVAAIATRGEVIAHGIALQPGRSAAIGRIVGVPVVALPGAPDQALAAWWTLALVALDRLSGRSPRPPLTLPLLRKISSSVGITELVLLQRIEAGWMPTSIGEMSFDAIVRADAWLAVPGASEGFAVATPVGAYLLRQ